jgi:hypothetical protein
MKWSALGTITLAAVAAFALAACRTTQEPEGPPPPPAVYTAKQACEIDTLAREHQVVISNLEVESDSSNTIAAEKLKEYRAEIDASYRFVVQNCNNYNMCMQAHDFHEPACDRSRDAWAESHTKFNQLAQRLAELEVVHPRHGRGHHGPRPENECRCDEVFTTGCCNENY